MSSSWAIGASRRLLGGVAAALLSLVVMPLAAQAQAQGAGSGSRGDGHVPCPGRDPPGLLRLPAALLAVPPGPFEPVVVALLQDVQY